MSDTPNTVAELAKDESHRSVAESRFWCAQYKQRAFKLEEVVARLMAENELLKKDAERYRKLADAVEFGEWGITDGTQGQSVLGLSGDYYLDDKADMDKRIDALPTLKGEPK